MTTQVKVPVQVFASALIASVMVACSPAAEEETAHLDSAWSVVSTSGLAVRLTPPEEPLHVGVMAFQAVVEGIAPDTGVTVDVISPSMPMHGIQRVEARSLGEGRFEFDTTIPMEGAWALYVNLGSDADAAAFSFDVLAAEGSGEHQH